MPEPTPPPSLPPHLEPLRTALASQYAIERAVGAGGMGTVLLARDVALDRPVAIKVVSSDFALTGGVRERFLREARTVAKLRHPNIVAVHTAGEAAGMLYFVMEFVDGESLRERLARDGPLDATAVLRLVRELAGALEHAHAAGVVHRDLKPENVLLERATGTARLTDFGVARAATGISDDRLTGTGIAIGTPRYMSPEQATGERTLDGRSDIYSLGLLAYEALTGRPVFEGTGPTVIVKQLTERPEPVATKVPGAPPALAAAIDRALEKDPDARWPSAGALRDALADATAWTAATVPAPPRRRVRQLAPLFAAAMLLAAAVALYAWWGLRGDGPARDPRRSLLVLPFTNVGRAPSLDWLREGSVSMLTFDMGQWRDLSVVGFERTLDLVRGAELPSGESIGLESAIAMAKRADAGSVVMGDFQERADSLFVTARLYDVRTGELREQVVVAGPGASDPRTLFDELSRQLLGATGAPAFAARPGIAAQTTSSLTAFRHYVEGVTYLTSWRLDEADSAFARAIAADSTFALAYYKRSIGQGWRTETRDSTKRALAQQAVTHAARLPERERQLISAYAAFAEQQYEPAKEQYSALVARDSADAEAWYGLADAAYHSGDYATSLRAFQKALALDPTLHLAYAHEVDLFVSAAEPSTPYVLVGDSIVFFRDRAHMDSVAGADSIASLRRAAAGRAVRTARRWQQANPRAPQAHLALANALVVAGEHDNAEETLRRAMAQPEVASSAMPLRIAAIRMRAGRPDALDALHEALDSVDAASLRADMSSHTVQSLVGGFSVAAYGGSPRTLRRLLAVADTVFRGAPIDGMPIEPRYITEPAGAMLRMAMGDESPSARRSVDQSLALIDGTEDPVRRNLRSQFTVLPYLAYLVFRDDRYRVRYNEWANTDSPTLGAIAAVARGDSARARHVADSIPGAATVGSPFEPRLRVIGHAAVYLEVGDYDRALAMLEAMDPRYFNVGGPEIRWAFLPRSHFVRGTLYERLGQRDKAVESYRRFLELWRGADAEMGEQLRAAREALRRLGEIPP